MIFGRLPERVAFPGGPSRSAFVVDMGDAAFIFAKRKSVGDARLEADVLQSLGETGYVPKLRAVRKRWVVQECLLGHRLPVLLDQMDAMEERKETVTKALNSLLHIQEAAMADGLQHRVPEIGIAKDWVWNRTGAAKRMSNQIGIQEPALDRQWLTKCMDVERTEFIKWDARPGNALVDGERAYWFDWEDCGRGIALNDLAFVLCDEWMNLDAAAQTSLEQHFLPLFNRTKSPDEGYEYLRVFGVTHTVIRLRMALKYRIKDGRWWDRQKCLAGDKVGVTESETSRLISRGKRLANDVPQLRPYIAWFDEIAAYFDIPTC
ncbi:MAG: phosphotransferase [Rhizobiaceae bacterium]